VADGHPEIYNVTVFELGNEQENPQVGLLFFCDFQ